MSEDAITQIAKIIFPDFDYASDTVKADIKELALECFSVVLPSTMQILSEREALRAENEKLRVALKPFAKEAASFHPNFEDGHLIRHDMDLTLGDLRAAAAASQETE